ncbi:MAG: hypothetical protein ACFCU3_08950 [Verrucomicrobiales bacterium]
MKTHCVLNTDCPDRLKMAMEEFQLSAPAEFILRRLAKIAFFLISMHEHA